MTVIETTVDQGALEESTADYARDTITLNSEDRGKLHGRRRSDGGAEFGISLSSGGPLKAGDCFVLESEKVVVAVVEADEPVYVIRPADTWEWAYYAYQIGNRHQKVMIAAEELVCLEDPAVKSLFDQLGVSYFTATRPFTPALGTVGHSH